MRTFPHLLHLACPRCGTEINITQGDLNRRRKLANNPNWRPFCSRACANADRAERRYRKSRP